MSALLQWRSLARITLQLAVLALLAAAFFMAPRQVSGMSMEPHIAPGEYVLINTFAYRVGVPRRQDIVAFRRDGDARGLFIKRVIGLPGDRVRVDRGTVVLNGSPLLEPYVRYSDNRSFAEVTVPPGSVFVLGDNRAVSEDSRVFGPIADDHLMGRAMAGLWPLSSVGAL
ncbi:MAG TPA: signal peptidase I [Candidatus Baltobacteraceae bacterium]